MKSVGVFDILGPVMVGPSSSHTAGAARLGKVARAVAGGDIEEVTFYLHGSFAKTYKGHGTDRALVAGILGMEPSDLRLRDSLDIAKEMGLKIHFKEAEIQVAIDKTKKEQVDKAVEVALKKAGINPAHVDSEEHMESNKAKGWITDEDIAKAKEIIATVSAEKAANLPQQMIENIAKGRLGKFLKEVCLLNQEDIMDGKKTVREVLKEADPELQIVAFKRFTLRAE